VSGVPGVPWVPLTSPALVQQKLGDNLAVQYEDVRA
jgi:hypothetical protein